MRSATSKEVLQSAEFIFVEWDRPYLVLADLGERKAHSISVYPQGKLVLCSSKLGEYVAQVWATVLWRDGITYLGKLREHSRNPEITGLLRAVTGCVRQCEIAGVIFATELQRLDVVDINGVRV